MIKKNPTPSNKNILVFKTYFFNGLCLDSQDLTASLSQMTRFGAENQGPGVTQIVDELWDGESYT